MKRRATRITRGAAQVFFDAQQLIVFGDPIGARKRAGLDLAGVGGDGQVGDERIFGFAGAMRDDRGAPFVLASSMQSRVSVSVPI